jgi:chitinase
MALPAGSPAVDAIPPATPGCPGSTDQRGIARPQGKGCDIGAYELVEPTTSVIIPSNGATVSGTTILDASASNATSVEFRLLGGIYGYNAPVLCTATPTYYGWLCSWNTTTIPNGSYELLSEAFGAGGSAFSSGVSITVANNPPPTTSVIIPSNGATLSGCAATLDASASNATSVEFWLLGGSYGLSGHLVGTATPTIDGWLDSWNTTTVPNGTYLLLSEAFGAGGSTFSSGVSITVHN